MATFGVNMSGYEGKAPGGSWVPPDVGRTMFEITGVNEGVNGKGEFAGERYITAKATQISGDDPGTKSTSIYLGLSDKDGQYGKPIEQTVGWLKSLGRMDLLENEDADTEELLGTTFWADVKHKTGADGNVKVMLSNVEPISHADGNIAPPNPTPAKPPTTMRRGR